MAEQADRLLKRKRIKSPTDDNVFVDIPVIYTGSFVTAAEKYQEGKFFFKNDSTASRKVHIQRVTNHTSGDYADVERIDSWFTTNAAEQYQETEWKIADTDPPPVQPDGSDNPAHEKKHVVRYFTDNDDSSDSWVDVELIDELKVTLPQDQYQEYEIFPLHADKGDPVDDTSVSYSPTKGFCDPALDPAPVEDGLDPPYRTDPLSNIVNVRWFTQYYVAQAFFNNGNGYVFWSPSSPFPVADPAAYIEIILQAVGLRKNAGDATKPHTNWQTDTTATLNVSWLRGQYPHQSQTIVVNGQNFGTAAYGGPPWQDLDQGGGQRVLSNAWNTNNGVNCSPQTIVPVGPVPGGYGLMSTGNVLTMLPSLGETSTGGMVTDANGHEILGPVQAGGNNQPFHNGTSAEQQIYAVDTVTGSFPSPGLNYHWSMINSAIFDASGLVVTDTHGHHFYPVGIQVSNDLPEPSTGGEFQGGYLGGLVDGGRSLYILFMRGTTA
jgi:hypothetical protein